MISVCFISLRGWLEHPVVGRYQSRLLQCVIHYAHRSSRVKRWDPVESRDDSDWKNFRGVLPVGIIPAFYGIILVTYAGNRTTVCVTYNRAGPIEINLNPCESVSEMRQGFVVKAVAEKRRHTRRSVEHFCNCMRRK